ncbi:MAG: GNAT family N-acetyltransferase [Myxococcota bacterium]
MKFHIEELSPERWPDFEALFGKNGACAGCWCMFWRTELPERFEDIKGTIAKRRMKAMVLAGEALGALAYDGERPVGWVSFGPRREYKKLDRAPSLRCEDADQVWSVPCFFVHKDYRGAGVSTALLAFAVKAMKRRGATIVEGYPTALKDPAQRSAAAFIYTGVPQMFEAAGFKRVGPKKPGKQRMRRRA